jgi:DNA mismatch repair protein MutL
MHITVLDPLVARRIAAGEVIERPASVVRELLDNAIDAHPSMITVALTEGGTGMITVMDDGDGIAKEDLPLCCVSHATSKVHTLDDLYHLSTMGFRGEALYSISSVSRTTIASAVPGEEPFSITVDNGKTNPIVPGGPDKGTRVTVEGLFMDIPARRQFLKRPATEAQMCRNVFLEKAMAFPQVEFRLDMEGERTANLPATTPKGRVVDILKLDHRVDATEMEELSSQSERFRLYAVTSSPALHRSDRSGITIFVNKRPVEDYALVQAVTYGYGEMLPGSSFPYCSLFIDIDPTLVDFNIHPTKREVKLRNKAEVHHAVSQLIQGGMRRTIPRMVVQTTTVAQPTLPLESVHQERPEHAAPSASHEPQPSYQGEKPLDPEWFSKAREILQSPPQARMEVDKTREAADSWDVQQQEDQPIVYIGQAFNLFLIAQKGDDLYLVDQHAAHERILFDELRTTKQVQTLLVPRSFEVAPDVDAYLAQNLDVYLNLGIKLEKGTEPLMWKLLSVPSLMRDTEGEIVDFIREETGSSQEVEKGLYAIVSCHKAIRQGDVVDRATGAELVRQVFRLEDPVCPHGRTFVIRLSKKELMEAVGRIV